MKQLNELKLTLIKQLKNEYADLESRLVNQAVNDAYALAAQTAAPLLVLPSLAEEKVERAGAWSTHQRSVLRANLFALAA